MVVLDNSIIQDFEQICSTFLKILKLYLLDTPTFIIEPFFSCRGLSDDGLLSDNSAEENAVRRLMMKHSKKKIFLCNSDKTGNKYLNNLCHVSELDEIICEKELPDIAALIK